MVSHVIKSKQKRETTQMIRALHREKHHGENVQRQHLLPGFRVQWAGFCVIRAIKIGYGSFTVAYKGAKKKKKGIY